jgi:hypothetical protein
MGIGANNFELHLETRRPTLSLSAVYLLRHILYTHNLPLSSVLTLWGSFHVPIMRKSLDLQQFILQTTLWNNVHRLHYIVSALANKRFHLIISQHSPKGFWRYFHVSSDDSVIQNRNRQVLIISVPSSNDASNLQPLYRHVTVSVSIIKSASALKNAEALIDMLTLEGAASIGGGCNDNATNAQIRLVVHMGK